MQILRHSYSTSETVSEQQLKYIRIGALIMAGIVLLCCLVCIIIIKRNIKVDFSLSVVGLVVVINVGFIVN